MMQQLGSCSCTTFLSCLSASAHNANGKCLIIEICRVSSPFSYLSLHTSAESTFSIRVYNVKYLQTLKLSGTYSWHSPHVFKTFSQINSFHSAVFSRCFGIFLIRDGNGLKMTKKNWQSNVKYMWKFLRTHAFWLAFIRMGDLQWADISTIQHLNIIFENI